jgi:mRNA interferase YafQ
MAKKMTPKEFFAYFSSFEKDSIFIVDYSNKFAKSIDLCYKRNLDLSLMIKVIETLITEGIVPDKYKPHPLTGYRLRQGEVMWDCHIKPDWILIWLQNNTKLTLVLTDTGSHSDLF